MNAIKGFFGEYRWLSNFHPVEVHRYGEPYASVEHAYQASKFPKSRRIRLRVANGRNAGEAKRIAYMHQPSFRKDWEKIKERIMLKLLRRKFRDPELRRKMLATGDAYLEETNHWNDTYWGVCRGKGANRLGHLLMRVRKELRGKK